MYRCHTPGQMFEAIESLEKDKTRYVIWDTTFETVMAPTFLPGYRPPADSDRVIEPYLNEHYKEIGFENGFRFMERRTAEVAPAVGKTGERRWIAAAAPGTLKPSATMDALD